jgi:hypothetical protein
MARMDEWRYGILSSENSSIRWCWYVKSSIYVLQTDE